MESMALAYLLEKIQLHVHALKEVIKKGHGTFTTDNELDLDLIKFLYTSTWKPHTTF